MQFDCPVNIIKVSAELRSLPESTSKIVRSLPPRFSKAGKRRFGGNKQLNCVAKMIVPGTTDKAYQKRAGKIDVAFEFLLTRWRGCHCLNTERDRVFEIILVA